MRTVATAVGAIIALALLWLHALRGDLDGSEPPDPATTAGEPRAPLSDPTSTWGRRAAALAPTPPRVALSVRGRRDLPLPGRSPLDGQTSSPTPPALTPEPPQDFTAELQPRPPWPGPWPTSISDLPADEHVDARIIEYGGHTAVENMLRFLAALDVCMDDRPLAQPGGLSLEVVFTIDPVARSARGTSLLVHQSTLTDPDTARATRCIRATTARDRPLTLGQLAALTQHRSFVWRTFLHFPVRHDAFYAWLLGGDRPPARADGAR